MASNHRRIIAVTPADKAFYEALRQRIAERRKAQDLIQQQLEQISQLPRAKQRFVIEMLDTVLQQTG